MEQPLGTALGSVAVDLLFLADARSALLAVECKEGTVQEPQAVRYDAALAIDVVQTANVSVADPASATLDVAYAVDEALVTETIAALSHGRIGVISIGSAIQWQGPPPIDEGLRRAFASPIETDPRSAPRLLLVDEASPASALAAELANVLQTNLEQGRESVTVSTLVEQACWGAPRFGRAFRGSLERKVRDMLSEAAKDVLLDVIKVERPGRQNDATVRLVAAASGAATQAGELRGARAVRAKLDAFVAWATGQPVPSLPGQLQIEGIDLIDDEESE